MKFHHWIVLLLLFASCSSHKLPVILCSDKASPTEKLAAKELRRYIYLRTGSVPELKKVSKTELLPDRYILVTSTQTADLLENSFKNVNDTTKTLHHDDFYLYSTETGLVISGGSDIGTLYGVYHYLQEKLNIGFYLHGDVIPDGGVRNIDISGYNKVFRPLFGVRGINPYHDFPEGPDWWDADNYKSVSEQLVKMKMNFIGLHTYTSNGEYVRFEPTVWQGLPEDINPDGTVKTAYPAKYANTGLFSWGYRPKKTSEYNFGGDQLFTTDNFTTSVMDGLTPVPSSNQQSIELFNRTGRFFKDVFSYAQSFGIKTCVGTEVPQEINQQLAAELKNKGLNPNDPSVIARIYRGSFEWIKKNYPVDYFWLWTNEGWTWNTPSQKDIDNVVQNLKIAYEVNKQLAEPFHMATSGWVLGPPENRALFDNILPKDILVSCINRNLGFDPVDIGFAKITNSEKWVIPWMEDDPSMINQQLWVGRTRRDAADALAYGCNGLLGIHWRTDIIGPNLSALALAAWDQSKWNNEPKENYRLPQRPIQNIAGTNEDTLYSTIAVNPGFYIVGSNSAIPLDITLKFCEPEFETAGKRTFDVFLNDSLVCENLDIAKQAGKNKAYDLTFKNFPQKNFPGRGFGIKITLKKKTGFPVISGIVAQGKGFRRKINCSGEKYKDYEKDLVNTWNPRHPNFGLRPNDYWDYTNDFADFRSTVDFYKHWCFVQFGISIANESAAIFTAIDGKLPRAAEWYSGPGNIKLIETPWELEQKKYAFVDQFENLLLPVKGKGNLDRYQYWLYKFKFHRTIAQLGCTLYQLDKMMDLVKAEKDPGKKKTMVTTQVFPVRTEITRLWGEATAHLLESLSTPGEMGTLSNLENHNYPAFIKYDSLMTAIAGPLPGSSLPGREYKGKLRVIVPAVRTLRNPGEDLKLKVIILGQHDPSQSQLYWKPLGESGDYKIIPLKHISRGVYEVVLPAKELGTNDIEYFINVIGKGESATFPVTAPEINQTIVLRGGI